MHGTHYKRSRYWAKLLNPGKAFSNIKTACAAPTWHSLITVLRDASTIHPDGSGGSRISRRGAWTRYGGRGSLTRVLFTENVRKNERIGSHSGGVDPLGGVDLQCGHFSPKMDAKMKELGPIGGRVQSGPGLIVRKTIFLVPSMTKQIWKTSIWRKRLNSNIGVFHV